MLTFNTISSALSSNATRISLSAVCIDTGEFVFPIKSVKSGKSIDSIQVLPLSATSLTYWIPINMTWTLTII